MPHGARSGGGINVTVAVGGFRFVFSQKLSSKFASLFVKIAATGMKKQG